MKKLVKKNIQDILALTPLQEGMLFHHLKAPESHYYFEQLTLLLSGEIDIQPFESAWNFVIQENEMLRAAFRWERAENPFQIILKEHHIQPAYYDLSGIDEHQRKKRLEEIKRKDREKKFDLKKVPFRITLCKIEKDKYAMIISNHHILYDGWSNGIILKEFFAAYNDFFYGKALIKPVKSKFKEFVKWCKHPNRSSGKDKLETFWKNYLKDFDSPIELPIKSSRREKRTAGDEKYQVRWEKEVKEKLEDFVKKQKVTLASFMYSAWGLLLQKFNDSHDVIFGTTVSGRSAKIPGIEDMVGLFINTLPLRIQGHSHERIDDFLYRIEKALQSRQAYESTPLVDIKKLSEGGRKGELFDTIVVVENYPMDKRLMLENSILSVDSYQMYEHTHYDLTVSITVFEDIHCMFTYCRDKLDKDAIVRLSSHFRGLVENIITNPHKKISELEIISREEKERILYKFNHTDAEYPRHKTIHQLFAGQAEKTPDLIALVGLFSNMTYMTYEEFNRKSDQLACQLQAKGVKTGSIVGIMLERSLEMVIGILGILKAGGAYLPVDPAYPEKRIEYILKDSGAMVLLTNLPEGHLLFNCQLSIVNCQLSMINPVTRNPQPAASSSNLAYVIYTSGSTGRPKGVMVEHTSVVNLLFELQRAYPLMERDTYLLKTSYVFDVSVTELFGWFLEGGKLAILEKDGEKDPRKILDTIERVGVTHINFVPSMFNMFIETCESNPQHISKCSGLKYIFLAGEVLLPELINRFRSLVPNAAITVENIYGPTEAAVYTSRYSLSQWKDCGTVPIGKPLENMKLYILDKDDHLQPIGVPGECCIAGVGVARGYLNNPDLTNSKFQRGWHPLRFSASQLLSFSLYHTGDLARWLPDGNIEFLGRIDQQVKMRGFRVELGEIESQLLKHPNIREAVVVAKGNNTGDKYLCAYIVAGSMEHGAWKNTAGLREYLAQHLPDYMLPTYFVLLAHLPLTPSGKIDRKALPDPEVKASAQSIAPRNQREEALVDIWSEVLGIDKEPIGIDDHFFRLGGHSLRLIALISRIHKKFNIEIPLAQVFKSPTIREISNYIAKSAKRIYRAIEPAELKEYYPLSSAQKRLFVFQQGNKDSMVYNMPGKMVLEGEIRKGRLEEIFRHLINRHESFRTSFETIAGEPIQRIHKDVEFSVEQGAWSVEQGAWDRDSLHAPCSMPHASFVRPFDLSCAPLLRVGLTKIAEQKHLLLLDMHHIVSDGMSVKVLLREFTAFAAGEELPPLKLQYKDYAQWQHNNKVEDWMIKQGEYWEEEFLAISKAPALELPHDFTKPKNRNFEGKQVRFEMAGEEAYRLKALALEQETTLYVLLFTIYYVFLSKLTGQEAIVVGTAAAGRRHADLESIIGMFVNTLILTAYPGSRKVFTRFLKEVKEKAWEAFENKDYPFEQPLEPVTLFALQDMNIDEMKMQVPSNTSKFDLMLLAEEAKEDLVFTFEYRIRLFKDTTIRRFIRYFKRIAETVVERPAIELSKIEIISKEEKNRILYEFNDTTVDYPRDKTVHQLFEEQVGRVPGRIAVHRTYRTYMTYEELNRKANQLACQLQTKGVKPNSIVGIMVDRSIEMVTGILGILKAGGAYLPIDPAYPEERITYMLRDSGVKVLLTDLPEGHHLFNCQLSMISPEATLHHSSFINHHSGRLAYVIYTSGSTGRPKGVMVEHRNVVRLVKNTNYIIFRESDRVLQTGSLGFDASTFEIWGSLLNGLTLYLADRDTILAPEKLKKIIIGNNITFMWMTSPLFNQMVQTDIEIFSSLTNLLVGGDVLSPLHINRVRKRFPQLKIINGYGPTENTTFSTTFLIEKEFKENIPIGKPIANSTVYIVDKNGHLQPIGIAGELWVGGDGVSRGYLNNPELTNSKFQRGWHPQPIRNCKAPAGHPLRFSASQLPRFSLYRTGDLARWLPDGNIEFLGRRDQQVKIRGFRIEPREIERCLLEHESVKEAVVLARKDAHGDKYLCTYIVPHSTHSPISELREYLSHTLPDYMIPSYFVSLEKISLTPNGKVDWPALPEPETAVFAGKYAAPRDETEKKLSEIWQDVLSPVDSLCGIDDDFFQLGGHSIKATLLAAKIHKTFHVNVSLTEIFTSPTIRGLAACIKDAAKEKYIAIPPTEIKGHYALSSGQKRLYVLQQMDDQGLGYNIPSLFQLEGTVDKQRLENIFKQLIKRHESFRTSFHMKEEEPVQKIHKDVEFSMEHGAWSVEREQVIQDFVRPFDLSLAPLLRVGLIEIVEEKHILILDMHHIISDGVSMGILIQDFISLYKGEPLPMLQVQYKDYADWQHCETFKEMIKSQEGYWLKEFAGEIPVLNLPFDHVRPAVQSFEGHTRSFAINEETFDALEHFGLGEGTTLFMVLLTVTTIFLSKISGQEDIVIGTPAAGRSRTDLQQIIGMFVNTLPLRNSPKGEKTFREFLREVKERALQAFENQDYPYEDLVEAVNVNRDTSRNPLFDAAFALQGPEIGDTGAVDPIELPGLKLKPQEVETNISKFDLTLFAIQSSTELTFRMEYCTKIFTEESIERFIGYFKQVISSVADNPGIKIGQIEIISEAEKRQVLFDFNQVEGYPYPTNKTLHGLFREQVKRTPDLIALVGQVGTRFIASGTRRMHLTYHHLNEKSSQLAHLLKGQGVQSGSIVGIMMERSIEMIIGILGILKASAAYLPINPKTPSLRRKYMMEDSGATVWLSKDIEGIKLNYRTSPTHLSHLTLPTHLSYVIYTSGSTGNPKAVPMAHANVCPLLHWGYESLGFGPGDRVIQNLPFYFDWSVWEIFMTLTTGASLYSVPEDILLNPETCIGFMRFNEITALHITPTQYRYLVNTGQKTETLNYLFIGAEKLTLDLVQRGLELVNETCRIFNMYGPTETAIISSVLEIDRCSYKAFGRLTSVPIGKPVANTGLVVLNKDGNLCPVNIPGELYVGGDGVAQGYLNNPEITKEKFTNHKLQITNKEVPFGPIFNAFGEKEDKEDKQDKQTDQKNQSLLSFLASQLLRFSLYRTGDLVRWLADGAVEFLGRIDHQVKIRGLRIELGEIENRLLAYERVKEAVVIDRAKGPEKYLCAYIVCTYDQALGPGELKQYLAQQLPHYMIPSYFVFLKSLPLSPNGKVDRKALPAPDFESGVDAVAPTNPIEARLLEIWSQVLEKRGHTSISIDDNFFQLGGHSLSAALLVSKIHKAFDVKVPLVEIFQKPTLRELARTIENAASHQYHSIERVEKKEYYPLSSAQKRLYLLYRMDPQGTGYNMPVVTTLEGRVEKGKLAEIFKQLILRHESLRTSFHMVNGEPVQKTHDNVEFQIEYDDGAKPRVEVFDLACSPLLRVRLIKTGEQKHLLVVDMHHIISDGLSVSLLVKEFAVLLKGVVLPEPGVTYKDYAQWQNNQLEASFIKKKETYWLGEFADEIPVLNLPTDFPRPAVQSLEGKGLYFEIGEKETGQLKMMALEQNVTLFMVLLTLLNILLARLSNQEDIVVGSPVAGRVSAELEQVIGMFVNTLALRNYPAGEKTFRQLLQEVRAKALAAFENQEYQFEKLVDQLPVNRDTGRSPLFDVALDVQGQNDYLQELDTEIDGLKLKPYPYHSGISKFDLVFHCEEVENKLLFTVDYAAKLFKEESVKRFINYFKKIVSHVIDNRDIRVGEIDILSEEEKMKILNDLNGRDVVYVSVKPIHQLFEEQVRRAPDGIAIHMSYRTHRTYMTYDQLNRKAAQLALLLQKKGVKPDSIVGIMMEPSLEMIISILALLKAGGAYLPIDPTYPTERIRFMLDDGTAKVLLTKTGVMADHSFTAFQGLSFDRRDDLVVTAPRSQVRDLDALQPVDRTSVNYEKYNRFIGQAMVKNAISLQATRGCPYHCAYCHKIWPGKHVFRSAENVFAEVRQYYRMGIRRFVFIDDIFNINIENSRRFFQLIIDNRLEVQFFFPNGLRGDLLTRDYIDLMVKAGTVNMALALETASPRLQKLVGKHMDLDKLAENLQYLCQQYPHVILELFIMHGFPTETEAEALQTLEFVKRFKWIHFPYFHILKIYPSTDMAAIAAEHGVSDKAIAQSEDLAFHQLPETLPFDKRFTRHCQADFFNQYFMLKERLLQVLPYQMKILTEDEMVQKYNSYLPVEVKSLHDLMEFAGIKEGELELRDFPAEVPVHLPGPSTAAAIAVWESSALNVLLLDLSQFFSKDKEKRDMLYDVVEPPLGLMYLLTALKKELGSKVNGRIAKSRIDFDNFEELKQLLEAFRPNLIGLRTLSYYKDFFHRTAAMIRHWGIDAAVIAGGPYATSDYVSLLKDRNIDLVVLGEGELTLCEIAAKMLENEGKLPGEDVLKDISGIAFAPGNNSFAREIIMMDDVLSRPEGEKEPAKREENAGDIAYVIYTSGTTGKPKGVLVEHGNVTSLMKTGKDLFDYGSRDVWTMFHSFCFDFSVWEMYGALLYGGKLVLIPRMMARDHQLYLDTLKKESVTILNQTPTVFYHLAEEEMKCPSHELRLRYVIFGGEALKPGKLKQWQEKYPETRLINMFGITETTVHVTFKEITSKEIDSNISNIGKPIPSLSGYITNNYLRLQPRNVTGELMVGGQGVARGYLNRPEMTAERFNRSYKSYRIYISYKTGDLVRLNGAGEMEYLGRIDHQVKIRGNRVELGEIERQMMYLQEIEEALVMARENETGDNYLCAYMKPAPGQEVNITRLREALATRLPVYMIPSYFIPLEAFPVTATGKVDRRKLPLPEGLRPMLGAAYEAPQTETARTTATIWQDILKLDKVGIHDNFFDLGGNSLDIVRLNARLKETFDVDIPLVTLFEYPTIHTFTRHLQHLQPRGDLDTPPEERAPDFSDKLKKGRDKMKGRRQRMR